MQVWSNLEKKLRRRNESAEYQPVHLSQYHKYSLRTFYGPMPALNTIFFFRPPMQAPKIKQNLPFSVSFSFTLLVCILPFKWAWRQFNVSVNKAIMSDAWGTSLSFQGATGTFLLKQVKQLKQVSLTTKKSTTEWPALSQSQRSVFLSHKINAIASVCM